MLLVCLVFLLSAGHVSAAATWTEVLSSTEMWGGITMSADGTKLAATVVRGNIWTSNNFGVTWTEDTSVGATKVWGPITMSADGTKLAATVSHGMDAGNIWTSSDSGVTWTEDTSVGAAKDWYGIASIAYKWNSHAFLSKLYICHKAKKWTRTGTYKKSKKSCINMRCN